MKTRAVAAKLISGRKLRLTRHGQTERVTKPHFLIRPGDQVLFMRGSTLLHVEMLSAASRRGPAQEARTHYRLVEKPVIDPKSDITRS
jgi:ribosome-associated heat shock protein Hsp15